jgi:hypothetical protein
MFLGEIRVVQAFETVTGMLSFFPGVPAILAAHMVATRDRRAGSLELLGSTPARAEERVKALCLAALAPALLALVLNAALFGVLLRAGEFEQPPGLWHVVQAPVTVLGAVLLGVMLAVWSPVLVTPVVAMVALVAANMWVSGQGDAMLFGLAVFWADWGVFDGSVWVGVLPGDPGWHVVYLLGLCGMAAAAAVVRVAARRAPVVALGLLSVAVAVVGGVGQLP